MKWDKFVNHIHGGSAPGFLEELSSGQKQKAAAPSNEKDSQLFTELRAAPQSERKPKMLAFLKSELSKLVSVDASKPGMETADFNDLGLDSLKSIEFRNRIKKVVGTKGKPIRSSIVFDHPSLSHMADFLIAEYVGGEAAASASGAAVTSKNPWLLFEPSVSAKPLPKLFCFHYAGGSAQMYTSWKKDLAGLVEVCPVQLPGRMNRAGEPAFDRMDKLVPALFEGLKDSFDQPYWFFSYSMGSVISFELVRHLRKNARRLPERIFVAANPGPDGPKTKLRGLSDEEFLKVMARDYGNLPEEVLNDAESRKQLLVLLRKDVELGESYNFQAEPPMGMPLKAYYGTQDKTADAKLIENWKRHTRGDFTVQAFEGGHFFIDKFRSELVKDIENTIRNDIALNPTKVAGSR